MCGRYSFVASVEKVKHQLGDIETGSNLRINFNIAPTQHSYVITNDRPDKLQYLTWGLIPYWSKDGKNTGKLINARMEGIVSKPSFRMPIRQKRCLVLADSFYEWRKEGTRKIPYRILLRNGELLLMAGIWDIWYKDDYAVKSFSIITTPPNKEMSQLHTRMPLILPTADLQKQWLEEKDMTKVGRMLNTSADHILTSYRVSEKLNSVQNNSIDLHQRLAEPPTLFD